MYFTFAGEDHIYVLNTQKAFLKIDSYITVYLLGVNSQTHTTVEEVDICTIHLKWKKTCDDFVFSYYSRVHLRVYTY